MQDLLTYTLDQFQVFVLVFFRMSAFIFSAPFFGSASTPGLVRVGLSLLLSLVLFPAVHAQGAPLPASVGLFVVAAGLETVTGLLIGFAATFLFTAMQFAGLLIDQELGLGLANVIDPISNAQVSIVGQFQFLLAFLFFLSPPIHGHLVLLETMQHAYEVVPPMGLDFSRGFAMALADDFFQEFFLVAIQISAPAVVALFFSTVAMAFLARAVPEMNIFILGFSLRIAVGFGVLLLAMPILAHLFERAHGRMGVEGVRRLIELMSG